MGQQCLQRVAKGPVGAPLKVPQHPGIQLLGGQPRLAVDGDAVVGGNIHIAAGGQGQRPADAKMGEQHLAQLAVYHLSGFLLDEVQRYIAQRKPHQRGKLLVRILADDGHQRGPRRNNSVSHGSRQGVAAAIAAGAGVAFAAGRQNSQRGKEFFACFGFNTHYGVIPLDELADGGLFYLHAALPGKAHQRVGNIHGAVAYREHPVAALGFQCHPQFLKAGHGVLRRHGVDGAHQKAGVAPHRRYEFLRRAVIGHIAAALAGHQYFARGTLPLFQHQHPQAAFGGPSRRE